MKDFNRGRQFGGRGDRKPFFGKKRWDDRRGPKEMHKAICSECGKTCEVPFRPTGAKPVYCKECFSMQGGNENRAPRRDFDNRLSRNEFRRDDKFSRPAFGNSKSPVHSHDAELGELKVKIDRLVAAVEDLIRKMDSKNPVVKPDEAVVLDTKTLEPKPAKTSSAKKKGIKKAK